MAASLKSWTGLSEQIALHGHPLDLFVDPLGVLGKSCFYPGGVVDDGIAYPVGVKFQRGAKPGFEAVADVAADFFGVDQAAIGDGRQGAATDHAQATDEGERQAVDIQRASLKRQVRDIANGARNFAMGLRRRMNAMGARDGEGRSVDGRQETAVVDRADEPRAEGDGEVEPAVTIFDTQLSEVLESDPPSVGD